MAGLSRTKSYLSFSVQSPWYRIDEAGNVNRVFYDRRTLAETVGVSYRDIRLLDTTPLPAATALAPTNARGRYSGGILTRDQAILVCLEDVRMLITEQAVFAPVRSGGIPMGRGGMASRDEGPPSAAGQHDEGGGQEGGLHREPSLGPAASLDMWRIAAAAEEERGGNGGDEHKWLHGLVSHVRRNEEEVDRHARNLSFGATRTPRTSSLSFTAPSSSYRPPLPPPPLRFRSPLPPSFSFGGGGASTTTTTTTTSHPLPRLHPPPSSMRRIPSLTPSPHVHFSDTEPPKEEKQDSPPLMVDKMPFELRVLEFALEHVTETLTSAVVSLEAAAIPALQALCQHTSAKHLENVRAIKTRHALLTTRVSTVRDELVSFLEDDEAMMQLQLGFRRRWKAIMTSKDEQQVGTRTAALADMALSDLGGQEDEQHASSLLPTLRMPPRSPPVSSPPPHPLSSVSSLNLPFAQREAERQALAQVEGFLETYMIDIDSIFDQLNQLNERITDSESLVSMQLDSARNALLRAEICLSLGMFSLAVVSIATGALGENIVLPDSLKGEGAFWRFNATLLVIAGGLYLVIYAAIRRSVRLL